MKTGQLVDVSHARNWRALRDEIQHRFAAARHRHPRAERWWLQLTLDPRLLPVDQPEASPGLMALHAALKDQGLDHRLGAHFGDSGGGQPGHRLVFHYAPEKNRRILSKPSGSRLTPNVFFTTQPDCATAQTRLLINPTPEIAMPDFTIRPEKSAHNPTQENPAMPRDHHHEATKRGLLDKLEELIFGKPQDPWQDIRTDDTSQEAGRGESPPPPSWLQAFNNALTDATAGFIRDYVAPLHAEDCKTGFLLRSIEVAIPDENLPALRVIAEMPAETRNRIAQARCLKAPGAKEQLVFEQFYGLSVVASDTLVDGFLVRALAASESSRLNLTFRFSGDYTSLPDTIADLIPDETAVPFQRKPLELVRNEGPGTTIRSPRPADTGMHTTIRMPRSDSKPPLFYITILEKTGEQRVPVDLGMLPLTIGAAPKHGRDITLLPEHCAGAGGERYISSEHLELIEYDPTTGLLYVNNKGQNGTYEGGTRLSERFTLNPAGRKTLSLGGREGEEGVVQVRIEPA